MMWSLLIKISFLAVALAGVGCDSESGLVPIETTSTGNSTGSSCSEDYAAEAVFENNFGLDSFCISYTDQGAGLVSFNFEKVVKDVTGRFSIALPHTEVGHVFSYSTREMILLHEDQSDHCEILKSASTYPMVTLVAKSGSETVEASSLDCDKENFFDVTVNAIKVAEKTGDAWEYELSAKYSREQSDPYYLKGRFEVYHR